MDTPIPATGQNRQKYDNYFVNSKLGGCNPKIYNHINFVTRAGLLKKIENALPCAICPFRTIFTVLHLKETPGCRV